MAPAAAAASSSSTPERPVTHAETEPREEQAGEATTMVPNPRNSTPPPAASEDEKNKDDAARDSTDEVEEGEADEEEDMSPSDTSKEEGEEIDAAAPPLPNEAPPGQQPQDDGWDCHWDAGSQAWFFYNRFTHQTTWENPRVPTAATNTTAAAPPLPQQPPSSAGQSVPPPLPAEALAGTPSAPGATGGYNPAIHGDYDPNAWYAQGGKAADEDEHETTTPVAPDPSILYASTVTFNRFTGQFQAGDRGPDRHTDEAKARRQLNAFFDVDAAANAHDGRSLKAERSGKKPTKAELKAFKEKRRAKKEEKRRAWLRD